LLGDSRWHDLCGLDIAVGTPGDETAVGRLKEQRENRPLWMRGALRDHGFDAPIDQASAVRPEAVFDQG
jgi:hypothetical protein